MFDEKYKKIAIVTGANAGVGFGICQRLIEAEGDSLTLVMACRNPARANKAKELLLRQFPTAKIDIEIHLFTKSFLSDRYPHVNYLFCNAGILSSLGLNWPKLLWLAFTDPVGLMERSDATIQAVGEISEDGLGRVFAANVFGHYVMMRELERLLSHSGDGRVIWTSSVTAKNHCFDINDWQGIKSHEPYESSKWACDLVSVISSERFARERSHISSFTTSPGVVASEIGALPCWVTKARILLHYLMRIAGVASQNITAYNGSIADVYAALQPLNCLNYLYRYSSLSTRWGKPYVEAVQLPNYDRLTAEKLVEKCELTYQAFKRRYASKEAE
ncbi:hypothetical protein BDF20DRAFT_827920 [Mycotypha africana]|uniref:uncharacterized protein n=1 Tax=Mycotypha africana TaxID=64632 RepID=UPI002301BE8F|nr:uncharacterized protein BDF20DRAFT_827920 [Mycotypha africana]KAI8968272.1 hypothetical protein BDF20DRAFT_827920 [Mycotypha africana]